MRIELNTNGANDNNKTQELQTPVQIGINNETLDVAVFVCKRTIVLHI